MPAYDSAFDKALVAYQKSALSFFYPPLVSFFAVAVGFSSTVMDGCKMSCCYAMSKYLSEYPLAGNSAFSTAVSILFAAAVVALFAFLTFRAVKGKFYALPLAGGLYLADLAYTVALYFPIYGQMGFASWLTSLILHIVFLALFSLTYVNYAKLSRLLKKSRE